MTRHCLVGVHLQEPIVLCMMVFSLVLFVSLFPFSGGFDMLWSGRGRINGLSDLEKAHAICVELELQGLIMVGGDGSNSNAALLSEYFAVTLPTCAVIGVPKTIDGDLRSPWIETSFGFDTAAKTYSELIGNLCTDVTTAQVNMHGVYLFMHGVANLCIASIGN